MRTIKPHKAVLRGKVRWRVIIPAAINNGKPAQRWFRTAESARDFAATLSQQRTGLVAQFLTYPQETQAHAISAMAKLADRPYELDEAVNFWLVHRPKVEMTVTELVAEALTAKEASGLRPRSLAALRYNWESFAKIHGGMLVGAVTAGTVSEWLAGKGLAPASLTGKLIDIRTLFSYAVKRGYLAKNPALGVDKARRDDNRPGILTVSQCAKVLRRARESGPDMLRWVAVQLFGGLRPEEARRIREENITAMHIDIFSGMAKGRRRRLVTINPTLKAWLDLGGQLPVLNLTRRWATIRLGKLVNQTKKRDAATGLGFDWPHDGMRHSFVSYAFPIWGATQTAIEAGHSEGVLFQHYREVVTKEQAEEFWALRPHNVESI
jgi:integrase